MAYQIEVDSVARRFLKKLPNKEYVIIKADIDALAENPRPDGYIKMTNTKYELYRIHTGEKGDYRIVYAIVDKKLFVTVVRVGQRKNIYKDL
ncbi:MAG: type II toxin-antitoxin system RelE/ParE family toxin [Parachlamydia sp.]|jgi:mRNA interferase RelE/StbE|nr:type II toxin-antitoxin system RelE/ParE family toxin [Parachlamydia sp.]